MGIFSGKNTKANLLLVDDEKDILKILSEVLEIENYRVRTASNGQEAWEKYQKEEPDLILTDIRMPVMGGDQLVALVREENKLLPIVVMSGYSDFSKEDVLAWGANRFYPKPGNFPLLLGTIEELTTRYLAATQK